MNDRNLTLDELRAHMDASRAEFARRVRKAIADGTLPVPELVMADGHVRVYKSIQAYHEAHPELDMLTCTEAVKAEAGV